MMETVGGGFYGQERSLHKLLKPTVPTNKRIIKNKTNNIDVTITIMANKLI